MSPRALSRFSTFVLVPDINLGVYSFQITLQIIFCQKLVNLKGSSLKEKSVLTAQGNRFRRTDIWEIGLFTYTVQLNICLGSFCTVNIFCGVQEAHC